MKKADLSQRIVVPPRITPPQVDARVDTASNGTTTTHTTTTDPVAMERSGDVKKVAGDVETAGGHGGQGAAQIVANLQIADDGATKKRTGVGAAVSGMLLALALTFGHADPSHAQNSTQQWVTHPSLVVLPDTTGPPIAFSSSTATGNSALN